MQITGTLFTKDPGIAHGIQVDEQAAEIIGRPGVDGQDLPGGKKRLMGEGLFRVGSRSGRRQNIFDVPTGAVGQIRNSVAKNFFSAPL